MKKKNEKAYWSFELRTECPNCEASIDLNDVDGFSYVSDLELEICEQDTDKSKNIDVYCPECGKEFFVDLVY